MRPLNQFVSVAAHLAPGIFSNLIVDQEIISTNYSSGCNLSHDGFSVHLSCPGIDQGAGLKDLFYHADCSSS